MAGVLARIKTLYPSLSRAEKTIADYVVRQVKKVPYQSVQAVAQGARVSVASVIRFSRAIGFKSFSDFKINLGQELPAAISNLYEAIADDDADETIVRKVLMGYIRSLKDTLEILDRNTLKAAARRIAAARRVVFLGAGGSGIIAADAALLFACLDVQVEAYTDAYQMLIQSQRLKKGDVVIGVSHSGRTRVTVECLKLARAKHVTTIGISNYARSPLHAASDLFLCTAFAESTAGVAALSSRVTQLCLIDVLYLLVARHKKNLWDVQALNKLPNELLMIS